MREYKSQRELQKLVDLEFSKQPACAQIKPARVFALLGLEGRECNWSLAHPESDEWTIAAQPAIPGLQKLRKKYLLKG